MNSMIYRLGDICYFTKGISPTLNTEPGEYPLVVTAAYRRSASTYQLEGPAVCIPLISSTGHGDAALHRVHYQEGRFALANLLVALTPKIDGIYEPKYLYHLFITKKDQLFVPLMQGTANVSLKIQDIASVEIPLPPLEEQRRIVAHIDALAEQIAAARGLRHSAVEEAEAVYTSFLNQMFGNPYVNHQGDLGFAQFVLVNDAVTDVADGPHVTPTYVQDGIPFVTVKNIVSGQLDFSDLKYILPEDHAIFQRRAKAEIGDVLITKDGTIGIPCYIDTEREFSFFVSVALIKPIRSLLDGRFLAWALKSPYLQQRMSDRSRGDMIRHLVLREIRNLLIPLPPLDDQHRIVAYLDSMQAEFERLKHLQSESAAELDALLPSLLDRAFRGEL